jgi:hypothetical protein
MGWKYLKHRVAGTGQSEDGQGEYQGQADGTQAISPPANQWGENHLSKGVCSNNIAHELFACSWIQLEW